MGEEEGGRGNSWLTRGWEKGGIFHICLLRSDFWLLRADQTRLEVTQVSSFDLKFLGCQPASLDTLIPTGGGACNSKSSLVFIDPQYSPSHNAYDVVYVYRLIFFDHCIFYVFQVFNLSERRYDISKLNHQVEQLSSFQWTVCCLNFPKNEAGWLGGLCACLRSDIFLYSRSAQSVMINSPC